MKVIVIGAGVVGVTTAWFLRQAGLDVTVLERQAESAQETSHANAGQLSYGYAMPWAAPGRSPRVGTSCLAASHVPKLRRQAF